jgi:hypothetical protein
LDFQSSALPTELPSQRGRALNPAFGSLARSNEIKPAIRCRLKGGLSNLLTRPG